MPRVIARLEKQSPAKGSDQQESPAEDNNQPGFAPLAATVASNYNFNTTTSASLTDMSSGTTTLIGADLDDVASAVMLLGFDFYLNGARQDRFSVNSNGTLRFGTTVVGNTLYDPLGQPSQSLITAYGADQRTHAGNGKVHFKVTGVAPNRVLIVEWLNMQSDFNAGGTADLTYQLRLSETTGAIEFVYGSMTMGAAGAADPNSQSPQMGFSSNNAVGTIGTITAAQSGIPAPTFSGVAAAPVNNLYVAGPITVLTSATDGSRRSFQLTSPAVTAPGGPLTFTGVTTTGMTLNWTDSPDELGYDIFVSTDGVNFSFFNSAAANATSLAATGLFASTSYTWRVYAFNEGSTAFISGTQMTASPTPNNSLGSGLWSSPATWSTGSVPTTNDAVTIAAGTTVTIDTAAVAYSVTVAGGGTLQFEQTTARTLTVGTDVTVHSSGTFQSNPAGTQTGHTLSLAGNLTNNGTLDFSTNADTAGAIITFTGATNNTFGGSGATTDIRQITVNKGTTNANIIELNPTNFTIRGVTTDTVVGGWLVMSNGTIKISGAFTGTSRVFAAAAYTIPASFGFWLNNPNYTVAGQNGSPTTNGLLRISQGTFNIGTASGNSMGFSTGSTITVEGGAVNATGRFGVAAAGNTISYTQTAGTITVNTIGNASATLGSFDLGTSTNSVINLSGGTIVTQLAATAIDYRNQSGTGILGVTGGTLQLGNAASGAAKNFNLRGVLPNVVITNTSAGHTATMSTTLVNFNNISRSITINMGTTFNAGNTIFLFDGTTVTNDGTLTHNGATSNFVWSDDGATGPQTYTGTGVATAPLTAMSFQNIGNVTFTSTNQVITNRANVFAGGLINSNKMTLGNGGATTAVIQFGVAGPTQTITGFDVPPVFNPGTGGVNMLYAPELTGRTTGNEMPPGRTLNLLSITNPNPITIAGGDVTVNGTGAGALALGSSRVITGANTLYFNSAAGTVTRTTGYVDGNFKKSYTAAASKDFEVGTANGYSPVTANITAGTFPTDFTAKAVQGAQPNLPVPAKSLQRYWALAATGVTADLTFNYLDPPDVPPMATESNFVVFKYNGMFTSPAGVVNTAANTFTVSGVTSFSDWTLAEPSAELAITKTDGVTTATPGGSVTYTITASNAGPSNNPSAVVADTFPASLTCTWTCVGAGGGTCTAAGSGNINDAANLPVGGSVTYTASCTISAGATGSLSNTATVAAPGGVTDPVPGNNSATDTDTLAASADLAITKTDGVTTATAGGSVTYTITASNAGPSNATGATVADTFPASLTCTWTCVGAGGGTCTASGSGNINGTVNLPAGGSVTYTASCSISAAATGSLSNTATVAAPGGVTDPNPANNSATDNDTVAVSADLAITKTDGVTTATPGGSTTYTIVASNAGPSTATSATVADTFPASLTCSWTSVAAGGATGNTTGPVAGNINNTGLTLPAGSSVTYTATCTISPSATGSLANTATVSSAVTDPNPANNSATDTDTLNPSADLSITKTDGVTTYTANGTVTYTIVVSNAGPSQATGAVVTDNKPTQVTQWTWVCSGATGGATACDGVTNSAANFSDTVTLPAGSTLTYTVTATIGAAPSGNLVNTATVAAPGGTTDPNGGNNSATDTDTLTVGVSAGVLTGNFSDPLACTGPGNVVTGTIQLTNPNGTQQAFMLNTNLTNLVALPGSCTVTGGVGASCAIAPGGLSLSATGSIPANGAITVQYQAQVSNVATGTVLTASSTATVGGVTATPNPLVFTAIVNCPAVGPGVLFPDTAEVSDQKAGSVLVYNLYSSSIAAPNAQNTRISITNTHPGLAIAVHLFFVDGATCSIADSLICLTPNQTASFLASDIDPGTTGYIVAVASDRITGCPIDFNYLIGDEYVKLSSGHAANLAAEGFAAIAGGLATCNPFSVTALLSFDGLSYNRAPRVLAASNIPSRADGNDTLIVLNRVGGSLAAGASTLGSIFGILYDDAENPLSFTFTAGVCQFRSSLSSSFPRVAPRFEQFVPAGRSSWAKFYSQSDIALLGAQLNFNANAGTAANAFNQGHNLHKLTLTSAATLTIPIFPPNC